MGEEARWVCNTCRTVCSRGGRPLTHSVKTLDGVAKARSALASASVFMEVSNHDYLVMFLDDLYSWLCRHQGHNIHVGSDYTIDAADLRKYYNESVDGRRSDATRLELETRSWKDWRKVRIEAIKNTIRDCKLSSAYGLMVDVDRLAEQLYDKHFNEDSIGER